MLKTKKLTLNLVKISFFLMLIYSVFFLAVLNLNIPRLTLILGGLTVVFMIVDMFYYFRNDIRLECLEKGLIEND